MTWQFTKIFFLNLLSFKYRYSCKLILIVAILWGHTGWSISSAADGYNSDHRNFANDRATVNSTINSNNHSRPKFYSYQKIKNYLIMRDGTQIAATYYLPIPKDAHERFPVILQMLPYRKDDIFATEESRFVYFAKRGFAVVNTDVRGTGSSSGAVPEKEYSEQEINDLEQVIDQLSKKSWSNGNVGMWGISWGGFNSIQVAMRNPPALKTIVAVCASDDLFKDDVHFIDGVMHVDTYELSMEGELAMPRSPDYVIDEKYFQERFDSYPWFLTYKKHSKDSEFWSKNSLRNQYHKLKIPVYLIGGLVDGYRDSIPRMLENLKGPVKAVIGPWNHAWPDDGTPGPVHEWREEVLKWWDVWLKKGINPYNKEEMAREPLLQSPPFAIYVRHGDTPDHKIKNYSGEWRLEEWPISRTKWSKFLLNRDKQLEYSPSSGIMAGLWWGEATGDMSSDDGQSMIYDGPVLLTPLEIIGMPKVNIRVSHSAPVANWIVRLEDVSPNGKVALVTGGILNGLHRDSRIEPRTFEINKTYDLAFELHFTTWTFKPGHKIRISVSNSQFPMIWPSPYHMVTKVYGNEGKSFVSLPIIPYTPRPKPHFPPVNENDDQNEEDSSSISWELKPERPTKYLVTKDFWESTVSVETQTDSNTHVEGNVFSVFEKNLYKINEHRPELCSYSGETEYGMKLKSSEESINASNIRNVISSNNASRSNIGRNILIKTNIEMSSSITDYYIKLTRRLYLNNNLIREKNWQEKIPRE